MPYLGKHFDPYHSQDVSGSSTRGRALASTSRGSGRGRGIGRSGNGPPYPASGMESRRSPHAPPIGNRFEQAHEKLNRDRSFDSGGRDYNFVSLERERYQERYYRDNDRSGRPSFDNGDRYEKPLTHASGPSNTSHSHGFNNPLVEYRGTHHRQDGIPNGPRADRPLTSVSSSSEKSVPQNLSRLPEDPRSSIGSSDLAVPALPLNGNGETEYPSESPTKPPMSADNLDSLEALRKFKEEVTATRKLRQNQTRGLDPSALAEMAESFLKSQCIPSVAGSTYSVSAAEGTLNGTGIEQMTPSDQREQALKERLRQSRDRSRNGDGNGTPKRSMSDSKTIKVEETASYEDGQIIETPTSSSADTPGTPVPSSAPHPVNARPVSDLSSNDIASQNQPPVPAETRPAGLVQQITQSRANFVPSRFLKPGEDRLGSLVTVAHRPRSPERSRVPPPVGPKVRPRHEPLRYDRTSPSRDYDYGRGPAQISQPRGRDRERGIHMDPLYRSRSPPRHPLSISDYSKPDLRLLHESTPDRWPRDDHPALVPDLAPRPPSYAGSLPSEQETIAETLAALKAQIANLERLAQSGAIGRSKPPVIDARVSVPSSDTHPVSSDHRSMRDARDDARLSHQMIDGMMRVPSGDINRERQGDRECTRRPPHPDEMEDYNFPPRLRYPEDPSPRERTSSLIPREHESGYRGRAPSRPLAPVPYPPRERSPEQRSPPIGPRFDSYHGQGDEYGPEHAYDFVTGLGRGRGRGRGRIRGRGRGARGRGAADRGRGRSWA